MDSYILGNINILGDLRAMFPRRGRAFEQAATRAPARAAPPHRRAIGRCSPPATSIFAGARAHHAAAWQTDQNSAANSRALEDAAVSLGRKRPESPPPSVRRRAPQPFSKSCAHSPLESAASPSPFARCATAASLPNPSIHTTRSNRAIPRRFFK